MTLLWDHPPHNSQAWVCDVPELGRYLIRRRNKGAREFCLFHNGRPTKYYGSIEELKVIVQRIASTFQGGANG